MLMTFRWHGTIIGVGIGAAIAFGFITAWVTCTVLLLYQ
jgi:hypothetical protein